MPNALRELRSLLPAPPLLVGTVSGTSGAVHTVTLPDGSFTTARGDATIGDRVFVRGGTIEGPAPNLPLEQIIL